MSNITNGDLVRLKSGGPVMVVRYKQSIDNSKEHVYVSWFKPDGSVGEHCFNNVVLVKLGERR